MLVAWRVTSGSGGYSAYCSTGTSNIMSFRIKFLLMSFRIELLLMCRRHTGSFTDCRNSCCCFS